MDINKSTCVFYTMSIYPKDRWVLHLMQNNLPEHKHVNLPFIADVFILYDNTKNIFIVRGKLESKKTISSKSIDYKPFSFAFKYTSLIEFLNIVFDKKRNLSYNTYNFKHLPDDLTTITYKYCVENMSSETMMQPHEYENNYDDILWRIKFLTDFVNENESV